MKNCSTKGCINQREEIDNLFCISCRTAWRDSCIKLFGFQTQADESMIKKLLIDFQKRLEVN